MSKEMMPASLAPPFPFNLTVPHPNNINNFHSQKSVFNSSSRILIDYSTRSVPSSPASPRFSETVPQTVQAGLLAQLSQGDGKDFGFVFGLTASVAYHFLAQFQRPPCIPPDSFLIATKTSKADLKWPPIEPQNKNSSEQRKFPVFDATIPVGPESPQQLIINCPKCSFTCRTRAQLAGHSRKHTGHRPFPCPDKSCPKRFTRKEELTRHVRIHSGLRPFQCCICDKRFGRKDHLNKHMQVHITRNADPMFQRAVCKYFASLSPSPQTNANTPRTFPKKVLSTK